MLENEFLGSAVVVNDALVNGKQTNNSRTVRRLSTFSTCGATVAKPARRRAAKFAMPLPSPGWAMQPRAL